MDYPKTYAQYRQDYRGSESERRVFYWLREFFKYFFLKVINGVQYYLIHKTTIYGTDKVQIDGTLQLSDNGFGVAPYLNFVKTGGTETAYTATPQDVIGYIAGTGYTGSGFYNGGNVQINASQPWSPGSCGTYISFKTTPNGTVALQDSGYIAPSGSWASGVGQVATSASTGFLYVPTCDGVPTGTPETITGRLPLVIDSTNNKAYFYSGGSWIALN